jgi:hypothetical protein
VVVVDIKDSNPTTNKCKDSNSNSTNSKTADNNTVVDTRVADKDTDTKVVAKEVVAVAVNAHTTATVGLMAHALIQVLTVLLLPKATRLALLSTTRWAGACDTVNRQPDKSGRRLILTLN